MPRPKGLPKTGGRKKGTKNHLTTSMRQAWLDAFNLMGGVESLVEWGEANKTEFYKAATRLIPLDVTSNGKELAALTWSFGDRTVKF